MRNRKRANEFAPTKSDNGPGARFSEGGWFPWGWIYPAAALRNRACANEIAPTKSDNGPGAQFSEGGWVSVGPDLSGRGVTRQGVCE